jgi:hypothetical protein
MPSSGYDTRDAGTSSFAFQPAQPSNSNNQISSDAPQAGVQGGDSSGGVVRADPITYADGNDGIPEFLNSLVEPYVKAKQDEMFYKGMDAAANGKAISEIASSDSGISRIFGPSYYHQGAAMYDSSMAVSDFHTKLLQDPDLYKQDDAARTKAISDGGNALMTGDPIADHLIQTGLIAMRGPVVATLAKNHYDYAQKQGALSASGAMDASGDTYRALAEANAAVSSPDDASHAAMQQGTANFIRSFQKPIGMSDESYQTTVLHAAENMRAKGNFFGYEAMKASGMLNPGGVLTDDQIDKLDKGYDRDASQVLANVAFDPDVNKSLATMSMMLTTGGFHSPKEIFEAAQGINSQVAAKTGMTDKPIISADDVSAMQKEYATQGFAAYLRLQSRRWELEDRQATWAHEDEAEKAKAAQALAAASGAVATGNVSTALAVGGVHSDDVNAVFQTQFNKGNMAPLVQNFVNSKYVNDNVANQMQSAVASSIGAGKTASFDRAHSQWQAMNTTNPGAATAYLGSYGAKMLAYDNFLKGGELPLSAYAQSFGKPDDGGRVDLPTGVKQADAVKQVDSALRADDRWALGLAGNRTPLAASSLAMMREVLMPKVAQFAKQSGVSMGEATAHVRDQMIASGELERSGPFAWTNPQGAVKMSSILGIPDDVADKLITAVAGQKLQHAGFTPGSHADNYNVLRAKGPSGEPVLYFQAYPSDGSMHKDVLVTLHDLQSQNKADARGAIYAAQHPDPVASGASGGVPLMTYHKDTPDNHVVARALGTPFHANSAAIKAQHDRFRPNDR